MNSHSLSIHLLNLFSKKAREIVQAYMMLSICFLSVFTIAIRKFACKHIQTARNTQLIFKRNIAARSARSTSTTFPPTCLGYEICADTEAASITHCLEIPILLQHRPGQDTRVLVQPSRTSLCITQPTPSGA